MKQWGPITVLSPTVTEAESTECGPMDTFFPMRAFASTIAEGWIPDFSFKAECKSAAARENVLQPVQVLYAGRGGLAAQPQAAQANAHAVGHVALRIAGQR